MENSTATEPKVRIEYSIGSKEESIKVNPISADNDNSLCSLTKHAYLETSRRYLNESITLPSRNAQLAKHFVEIKAVYQDLKLKDPSVFLTAFNIVQLCVIQNITDVVVSKTTDSEILLYRKKGNEFSNVVIDEDGDVSHLYIGTKSGKEKSQYFPKSRGLNLTAIAALL